MIMSYRGKRCAFIHVQKKQIRLHVSYHGWVPGVAIQPNTRFDDPDFTESLLTRFKQVFCEIDNDLAKRNGAD